MITTHTLQAAPWQRRAVPLAHWFWQHLPHRHDVWGGYYHPDRRVTTLRADGSTYVEKAYTAPGKSHRGKRALTLGRVINHVLAAHGGDVIGLHAVSPQNTSRWAGVEVDVHGAAGDAGANWRAATHWNRALVAAGFNPWIMDSNGCGGLHLRVHFDRPAPTGRVHRYLKALVAGYEKLGFPKPELFPKQESVPDQKYGNWLRLPGLHHTRPHYSKFYVNGDWLEGEDAVEFILNTAPDSARLLPDMPKPEAVHVARRYRGGGTSIDLVRALFCLDNIPNGDDTDYETWIAVGMALHSVDDSDAMLEAWARWSAKSNKHVESECARVWAAFDPDRERPVTLGTLVYLARRNGAETYPKRKAAATKIIIATSLPDPPPAPPPSLFRVVGKRGAA